MIQNYVKLEPVSHTYSDADGGKYASVSKVLNSYEEGFDAVKISNIVAGKGKYAGMTPKEIQDAWAANGKAAADHGTRIHEALERYTKEFKILPSDADLTDMVKKVCADYADYKRTYDENALYHPKFKIAGTADKILLTKAKAGIVDIEDYKTNIAKGIYYYSKDNKGEPTHKYMKGPLSHLQECNYNRYCLQLSIYALMLEEIKGWTVRSMWIRFIEPETFADRRIPVPYMKMEAHAVLEDYYNKNNMTILPEDDYDLSITPAF